MGYICIHGHFYQPPRENPWLEAIELQDSAHPYHDWNERINAECYAANAAARILNDEKRIVSIVNNYSRISFNFGPTLLSWMEAKDPGVYTAIQAADKESAKRFGGHGSALAQPYNHMIMPLANERDRLTQATWGLHDFQKRFGRAPEGMWLPETAVDLATLEVLAGLGIKFTVLAPNQARRTRKMAGKNWKEYTQASIDPTMAYRINLPSGKTIDAFFYDGPISRSVAFEGVLDNGKAFAERLIGGFSEETRPWPEIMHIATDGETYGHHHHRGEMALAYALDYIEANGLAELTNYGAYLERHSPNHFAEIFENSSWSCVHGVERWRSNCGCNSGGHAGWNQAWRAPLRAALDELRDRLAPLYEEKARSLLKDPWAARNAYIDVVLDRSKASREAFLGQHAVKPLDEASQITVWKLLELQRHAMLMYTSCGWFFDELSGIETVQVMQYAGRAAQLAEDVFGGQHQNFFKEKLSAAKSNLPEHGDGARVYQKFVQAAMVDLRKLGAHYAIRSLFDPYAPATQIYCYQVERLAGIEKEPGNEKGQKLAAGLARFTSSITTESAVLGYAALERGGFNPLGGVLKAATKEEYEAVAAQLEEPFRRGDGEEAARVLQQHLAGEAQALSVLFRDEQRRVLDRIIDSEWDGAETAFAGLYPRLTSLMRVLARMGGSMMVPRAFQAAAEFVLNARLRRALAGGDPDFDGIRSLLADAQSAHIALDTPTLELTLRARLEQLASRLGSEPSNLDLIKELSSAVDLARSLPIEINLWKIQNVGYGLLKNERNGNKPPSPEAARNRKEWLENFGPLAEKLELIVPEQKEK